MSYEIEYLEIINTGGNYANIFKGRLIKKELSPINIRYMLNKIFNLIFKKKNILLNLEEQQEEYIVIKKLLKRGKEEPLNNEIYMLNLIGKHKNIINMKHYKKNDYICLEYCHEGDLFTHIMKKLYTETEAIHILKQLIRAIKVCHDMNIVHADIKPENVLMFQDEIKLIDFGEAYQIINPKSEDKQYANYYPIRGTALYQPPELNHKVNIEVKEIELLKADLWSLGVTAFVMIRGYFPINSKVCKKIKDYEYLLKRIDWKDTTPEMKEFISALLKINPSEREIKPFWSE
jgi:serine/threonine protein kinase